MLTPQEPAPNHAPPEPAPHRRPPHSAPAVPRLEPPPHASPRNDSPPRLPPSFDWLKSRIDRYVALLALALVAPLMALLAAWIRRDSAGPALFRQARAGLHGRPFTLLKFRTMYAGADPFGDSPQSPDDARITPLGGRLRETSLDELPQLINVLRGEMSLVGPRPLYLQQMAEWNDRQRRRLCVRPGLTGLAQVRGRGALTVEDKLEWDVRYAETACLRMDLSILLATLVNVASRSGIYEVRYSHDRERRSRPESPELTFRRSPL
jgi:lipopolysaccharide/colanic/teichoic acid biosynthesis glycosyltransferase